MTLILKQIFGFLKLLNSETGTNQIAAGVAFGFILGMAPSFSLQTILVLILVLFFRVQIGAATLSAFFFKFAAWVFDPVFDSAGRALLEAPSLSGVFTTLYNMPLVPFTRFNNSVVLGAGVISFALFPVIFLLSVKLIGKYREVVVTRFKETKFWKLIKSTSLYKWYYSYDNLYGN
jgi:uncharacterized protein (TIGR03546 family)